MKYRLEMIYVLRYGNHRLEFGTVWQLLEELEEAHKVSRYVLGELAEGLYHGREGCSITSHGTQFEIDVVQKDC